MARNNDRDRDRASKRILKDSRPRGKQKVCVFCTEHATWVDYKDVSLLKRFMSDRGKIRSRRVTGNCAQHQRDVQVAIKTTRELALLPYAQRTVSERGPGRGSRGPRTDGPDRFGGPAAAAQQNGNDRADVDDEAESESEELEELEEVEA